MILLIRHKSIYRYAKSHIDILIRLLYVACGSDAPYTIYPQPKIAIVHGNRNHIPIIFISLYSRLDLQSDIDEEVICLLLVFDLIT